MPFFNIGHLWIVALLVIALVVFGPGKLPDLGGAVGKGIKEFRQASTDDVKGQPGAPPSTDGRLEARPKVATPSDATSVHQPD
ncbi:MAG: Sec-independent protein translocase subunit TatA/TatB [Candidatus Dormibacteraceae bacterium]